MPYQSLSTASSIRILTLAPGTSGPLQCSLEEVSLDSDPYYEALSYVWGAPGGVQAVICDGTVMEITRNLYSALWRLRHESHERVLWIDALCINQEDIEERSRQVNIMGNVYARADTIIVWLGEEDSQTAATWSLLAQLTEQSDAWDQSEGTSEKRVQCRNNLFTIDTSSWDALTGLLSEAWFQRVWTLQEVLANKGRRSVVHCGSFRMDWLDFYYACHWIEFTGLGSKLGYMQHRVLDTDAYISLVDAGCFSWWRVFFLARQRHATDLKDKVYSLFGLLQIDDEAVLTADYKKSLREIYIEATLACIKQDQDLWVLRACQEASHGDDLPSWVPDWRVGFAFPPLGGHIPEYDFDHKASLGIPPKFRVSSDSCRLELFGTILFNLEQKTDSTSFQFSSTSIKDVCARLKEQFSPQAMYHAKEGIESVIAQTLMGGVEDLVKLGQANPGSFDAILSWYANGMVSPIPETVDLELSNLLHAKTSGRCVFSTVVKSKSYIGLAPDASRPGDSIAIFHGSGVPFVVRAVGSDEYRIMGDCYVHGLMDGEVFRDEWAHQEWSYISLI